MKKLTILIILQNIFANNDIRNSWIIGSIQRVFETRYKDHPHINKQAIVTKEDSIDSKILDQNRTNQINKEFKKSFSTEKNAPRVALCLSGGGYRAMIMALGTLQALEEIDVLKLVHSVYSLSGSTWLLNRWLSNNENLYTLENKLKINLQNNIQFKSIKNIKGITSLPLNKDSHKRLLRNILTLWQQKVAHNQRINLIDCWGLMIAHNIFSQNICPYNIYLSEQVHKLKSGKYPLNISTAITPNEDKSYSWIRFTPTNISVEKDGKWHYIPTWSLGRKFEDGKSVNETTGRSPELPLAYLLGIFGSAFSGTPNEYFKRLNCVIHETKSDPWLTNLVKIAHDLGFQNQRISPAKIFNFLKGINNDKRENIVIVDAGIECNLPLKPALIDDSPYDTILVFDASARSQETDDLVSIIKKTNKNFKIISCNNLESGSTIIKLQDKTILYIPLKKIEGLYYPENTEIFTNEDIKTGYAQITNFKYTPCQFDALKDTIKFNIFHNKELLINLIKNQSQI